jgi:hypothetical protein
MCRYHTYPPPSPPQLPVHGTSYFQNIWTNYSYKAKANSMQRTHFCHFNITAYLDLLSAMHCPTDSIFTANVQSHLSTSLLHVILVQCQIAFTYHTREPSGTIYCINTVAASAMHAHTRKENSMRISYICRCYKIFLQLSVQNTRNADRNTPLCI